MALVPEVQAETTMKLAPFRRNWIDSPEEMALYMHLGTVVGRNPRTPFLKKAEKAVWWLCAEPTPVPKITATSRSS